MQKKHDKFWDAHKRFKPNVNFSPEFKDLINNMITFESNMRPTL